MSIFIESSSPRQINFSSIGIDRFIVLLLTYLQVRILALFPLFLVLTLPPPPFPPICSDLITPNLNLNSASCYKSPFPLSTLHFSLFRPGFSFLWITLSYPIFIPSLTQFFAVNYFNLIIPSRSLPACSKPYLCLNFIPLLPIILLRRFRDLPVVYLQHYDDGESDWSSLSIPSFCCTNPHFHLFTPGRSQPTCVDQINLIAAWTH